jgi:hypothetical protein
MISRGEKMAIILFIIGIIVALGLAAFRLRFLRIALNLLPVMMGVGCATYLVLIGRPTWAVIVALISLYATCPWWEYLDETVWMKFDLCPDLRRGILARDEGCRCGRRIFRATRHT